MSMNVNQQLFTILQSELNTASQLSTILQQEREALKSANHEMVSQLTQKKQPLILQLEQLGRQRESILKVSGFPSGRSGLEAFIANQSEPEAEKLTQLVARIREVAQSCRENNVINGGVINVNRQYLGRALSILRGRDPDVSAYGPGGEYTSQVVRQPLIGRV